MERKRGVSMEFTREELTGLRYHLHIARDSQQALYEAMKDIEIGGELDHDGQPVFNPEELKRRLEDVEELLGKVERALAGR